MRVAVKNGTIYVRADGENEREIGMVYGAAYEDRWQCHAIPDTLIARRELSAFASIELPPVPDEVPGARTKPWRHQVEGYWHARHLFEAGYGAMLGMEMGTGKSKVAVDLACSLPDVRTVLIICPKSVVPVWPVQFERHGHDGQTRYILPLWRSPVSERAAAAKAALIHGHYEMAIVVMNYDVVWRPDMAKVLTKPGAIDMLICDESHRLKDPGGRASKCISTIARRCKYRLALTGTPMSNGPLDLYAQFRAIQPDLLGTSYSQFRNQFAIMGGYGMKEVVGYRDEKVLSAKFHSIAFQASADLLDLPPESDEVVPVTLSEEAAALYEKLEGDFVADVEGGTVTAANALTLLLRLQQITGGYVKNDNGDDRQVDCSKREALSDLVRSAGKEPVVVFCRFKRDILTVQCVCRQLGRSCHELSGDKNELTAWQAMDHPGVLAVQIQAGGVGVDLTVARYSVYYSLGFSLTDYEQSRARIRRPGQTRPVTHYHLVAQGTVDEKVYKALKDKANVIERIVAAAKKGEAE